MACIRFIIFTLIFHIFHLYIIVTYLYIALFIRSVNTNLMLENESNSLRMPICVLFCNQLCWCTRLNILKHPPAPSGFQCLKYILPFQYLYRYRNSDPSTDNFIKTWILYKRKTSESNQLEAIYSGIQSMGQYVYTLTLSYLIFSLLSSSEDWGIAK